MYSTFEQASEPPGVEHVGADQGFWSVMENLKKWWISELLNDKLPSSSICWRFCWGACL